MYVKGFIPWVGAGVERFGRASDGWSEAVWALGNEQAARRMEHVGFRARNGEVKTPWRYRPQPNLCGSTWASVTFTGFGYHIYSPAQISDLNNPFYLMLSNIALFR